MPKVQYSGPIAKQESLLHLRTECLHGALLRHLAMVNPYIPHETWSKAHLRTELGQFTITVTHISWSDLNL